MPELNRPEMGRMKGAVDHGSLFTQYWVLYAFSNAPETLKQMFRRSKP